MTDTWMKAAKSSVQAHKIQKVGSHLLVTACKVALNKNLAVPANRAVMRCFECQQVNKNG